MMMYDDSMMMMMMTMLIILMYCRLWHFNSILQLLCAMLFSSIVLFSHFGHYFNKRLLACLKIVNDGSEVN